MVTRMLTAKGPWSDEQQSISLSGNIMDQFKQQLRPELPHVPLLRLDDLWSLTMMTLSSPAQYKGQQRFPWTRSTGQRVQNEPNDRVRHFPGLFSLAGKYNYRYKCKVSRANDKEGFVNAMDCCFGKSELKRQQQDLRQESFRSSRRPSLQPHPNYDYDFHEAIEGEEEFVASQPIPVGTLSEELQQAHSIVGQQGQQPNAACISAASNAAHVDVFTSDDTLPAGNDSCIEGNGLNAEELDVLYKVKDIYPTCIEDIGNELVTRSIRGYATYDNRIQDTAEALQKIKEWRFKHGMDTITSRKLSAHNSYHDFWPSYCAGEDELGHVIHYESIKEINTTGLVDLKKSNTCTLDDLLIHRAQTLEAVEEYKRRRSFVLGKRRYKEVTIVNLDGFSVSLFVGTVKEIVMGSFGIGGQYYPDALYVDGWMWCFDACMLCCLENTLSIIVHSLTMTFCFTFVFAYRHKMFIINAPWLFRTVWAGISPFIHPITKAKIKILAGEKAYKNELAKAGISMTQVPTAIGGSFQEKLVKDLIAENIQAKARE